MGFFGSSAPAQLHPVNPPLGVFPNYCVNHPTTLVLKEKAFSFSGVSDTRYSRPNHSDLRTTSRSRTKTACPSSSAQARHCHSKIEKVCVLGSEMITELGLIGSHHRREWTCLVPYPKQTHRDSQDLCRRGRCGQRDLPDQEAHGK
jgi:hypothetical protein